MSTHALIIEDNRLNIDVLHTLLENHGVSTTAIESPRYLSEALDSLERLDVVFLDLEFANHDGFDVLQELKADPRLANIPIVAYTVHTSEIDEARTAGFDSFLGKPLDPRRFPDQLARILEGIPVWEV